MVACPQVAAAVKSASFSLRYPAKDCTVDSAASVNNEHPPICRRKP
jgi:hypothetical protein